MKSQYFFPFLLIFFLGLFFAHALIVGKTVYGDGIYYYSWVRSIVVDGDTDFINEYQHFGVGSLTAPTGLPANKFGIGPALLWLPFFIETHMMLHQNGFTFPYQLTVGIAGTLYTVCGLVFIYLSLSQKFTRNVSLYAVMAVAYATPILYYGTIDTVNSHAAGFFVSSIILYLAVTKKNPFFTGILLGLLASIRFQDILFLFPVLFIVQSPSVLVGFFIGFLPQIAAWQSVYGSALVNTYAFENEGFRWLTPRIFQVLFAPGYGLLSTTPILIPALLFTIKKQRFNVSVIFLFLAVLYTVSSWGTYWQGASYGGRMFISLLPFLSPGLAVFFNKIPRLSINMFLLCTLLNIATLFRFLQSS